MGGEGKYDMASYENALAAVRVSLAMPQVNTGHAAGDTHIGIEAIRGSLFGDHIIGDVVSNRLVGLAGDDTIEAGDGTDTLYGGLGADVLIGGNGVDWTSYEAAAAGVTVYLLNPPLNTGEAAGDTFSGVEAIRGSLFGDRLTGGVGSNVIEALAGDDTLDGGAGNDRLVGNLGQDWLTGGAGADTFAFKALKESPVAAPDIITDFSQAEHDIIDLTLLDGRPFVAGNQEVQFVGTAAFLGKGVGQVRYRHEGGNTIIELDTSNRVADLAIKLIGLFTLTADDFLL